MSKAGKVAGGKLRLVTVEESELFIVLLILSKVVKVAGSNLGLDVVKDFLCLKKGPCFPIADSFLYKLRVF